MSIKSKGGHVQDPIFYKLAEFGKKSSERISVYGPFKIKGRKFAAAAYYSKWTYWKWIFSHAFYLLISFLSLKYYIKEESLAKKIKGIMVFDEKANAIIDKQLQKKVAVVTLVWVDTYLTPVFPPRKLKVVEKAKKRLEKIFNQCKNRKMKKPTNPAEILFFKELRRADKQVLSYYPIVKKYHGSLKNALNLFNKVSDKASDVNVRSLKNVIKNLSINFEKLANWCDDRANSWPDFVDSYELYRKFEERKKGKLERARKFVLKIMWNRLLSGLITIVSGGNILFSEACSIIAMLGREGLKILRSLRRQTKSLRKAAQRYRDFNQRARKFLELYDYAASDDFLR